MVPVSVSVVIPVHGSQATLRELVDRLEPVLRSCSGDYEVLLVNDGSRDSSWSVVEELSRKRDWVRGVDLMQNVGQHNALLCGIRLARHEVVVTMDDDLQHPPEEVPKLLAGLGEDLDVVHGTAATKQHGLFRALGSRLTAQALQWVTGIEAMRRASAFRAFRTLLRDSFADYGSRVVCIEILLLRGTTRIGSVEVRHDPRRHGRSTYRIGSLVTLATSMATGCSERTLRGLALLGAAGLKWLPGRSGPEFGWAWTLMVLACGVAFAVGTLFLVLAVIAARWARPRSTDAPPYEIRRTVNLDPRVRTCAAFVECDRRDPATARASRRSGDEGVVP